MSFISIDNLIKPKTETDQGKPAVVVDNNDPMRLQRIRVRCEGIYPDISPWVRKFNLSGLGSSANSDIVCVPEINSQVWIVFPFGTKDFPYYALSPYTQQSHSGEFDEDYPNVYGYYDATTGFVYKVNRNTKQVTIKIGELTITGSSDSLNILGDTSVTGNLTVSTGATGTIAGQGWTATFVQGICTQIT